MSTVHFSMGKKGGIGKSKICLYLIEGLQEAGRKVAAIDLDPATSTLKKYRSIEVIVIPNMLDKMGEIDPSRFDELIEIANARKDELEDIVVDTGASNCIAFFNYLPRNDTFDLFREQGHEVLIHVVIKGGPEEAETLRTFATIQDLFPNEKKILWLNEYEHDLTLGGKGAEGIADCREFIEAKSSIMGVFRLPYLAPKTEAAQMKKMDDLGILFGEVKASEEFKLAEKMRLRKFADIVIGQISDGLPRIVKKLQNKKEPAKLLETIIDP